MKARPRKKSRQEIADPHCDLSSEYFSDDLQTCQSQREYSHFRASPPYSNYYELGECPFTQLQNLGMTYRISRSGGKYFHDDPCKIFIGDFGFKVWDKFTYTYDFRDH